MIRNIAAHVQQAVEQHFGSEGGKRKSCACGLGIIHLIIWRLLATLTVDCEPGEVLGRKFGNPTVSLLPYHELRWTCVGVHNDSMTIKVCVHKVDVSPRNLPRFR